MHFRLQAYPLSNQLGFSKRLLSLYGWALLLWAIRYHPPGVESLLFDGDACQHVYWTARFRDPELFSDDLLTQFISTPVFDPIGYQWVYRMGTVFMDPLFFSQVLTLILLLLSLWLLNDLCGHILPDSEGRVFCLVLFLLFSLYDTSGGFPRTFAFPLLLAFLNLMQRDRFRWATATLFPVLLFYPPMVLNLLALAGWEIVSGPFRSQERRIGSMDVLWFMTVALIVVGVLLFIYGGYATESLGRKLTFEEARAMPEFHPGGRTVFFRNNLFAYLLLEPSGIGAIRLIGFVVIIGIMGMVTGFHRIRVPAPAIHLTRTSLFLFGVAHLTLFLLHHPSRYTLYTLPLTFMLIIGANTRAFLEVVKRAWGRFPFRVPQSVFRWLGWALLAAFLPVSIYVQSHAFHHVDMEAADPYDLELAAFLESLPKDALVAGHPFDMNKVPLFARRKVLANHELSLPYYTAYYGQIRMRLTDFFESYYSDSWQTVESFVTRYGISALVIRDEHFQESFLKGPIYYEPFNREVKARLGQERSFALRNPPPRLRCFENERYRVLCFNHESGTPY